MLYNPPSGATDPNAPYVGKDVASGRQGSKVPRAAIENTQREIVAAIQRAGLTPTNDDLTQLSKAIVSIATETARTVIVNRGIIGGQVEDYIVPGTYTYVVPNECFALSMQDVIGGGGGGGGAKDATCAASAGAGAGHGQGGIITVTPGETLTIKVAAGGTPGVGGANPTDGGVGGTSSIARADGSIIARAMGGQGGKASSSGIQLTKASGGTAEGCVSNETGIEGGLGYSTGAGLAGGLGGACPSGGGSTPGPNVADAGKDGITYGGGANGSSTNGPGGRGAVGRIRFAH